MKYWLIKLLKTIPLFLQLLFCFKKKVFLLDPPPHPNLGDQAQLMCTYKWIKETYPGHKIIEIPILRYTLNIGPYHTMLVTCIYSILMKYILKLFVRKQDIFIGHSGYFFVDHHDGWKLFVEILDMFPTNQMIILPQTINFYTPYVKEYVSRKISNRNNLTLLCRDEQSYDNAKMLFPGTKLLLYPDIVTSLVGTYENTNKREGIIFCMRNDVEAFYEPSEIDALMNKFTGVKKEKIDTTINVSWNYMAKHRDELIYECIEKISKAKVVITDRYHGTIFSAIASTPVIVISSGDHKLSSGVRWFEKADMNDNVMFANSLDEAYFKAKNVLDMNKIVTPTTYFRDNYWSILKEQLSNA